MKTKNKKTIELSYKSSYKYKAGMIIKIPPFLMNGKPKEQHDEFWKRQKIKSW